MSRKSVCLTHLHVPFLPKRQGPRDVSTIGEDRIESPDDPRKPRLKKELKWLEGVPDPPKGITLIQTLRLRGSPSSGGTPTHPNARRQTLWKGEFRRIRTPGPQRSDQMVYQWRTLSLTRRPLRRCPKSPSLEPSSTMQHIVVSEEVDLPWNTFRIS